MTYHCFKCGAQIEISSSGTVGRRDSCNSCGADVHVCKNCRHYDETAYNDCREPQADRVLDKGVSNYCDYFSIAEGGRGSGKHEQKKKEQMKALDELFKK